MCFRRMFINMTPRHRLEPPRAACGSLIMSLQVPANYCLVMVIDKAINATRDRSCWSEEIPLWATGWVFSFNLISAPSPPPLLALVRLFFFQDREGGVMREQCKLTLCTGIDRVVETQVRVNQSYQSDRLLCNHIVIWTLISTYPIPPHPRPSPPLLSINSTLLCCSHPLRDLILSVPHYLSNTLLSSHLLPSLTCSFSGKKIKYNHTPPLQRHQYWPQNEYSVRVAEMTL